MYHNSWETCSKISIYLAVGLAIIVSGSINYGIYFLWLPIVYTLSCLLMILVNYNVDAEDKTILILAKIGISIIALLVNMFCLWLIINVSDYTMLTIILIQVFMYILYAGFNYIAYAIICEKV